MPQHRSPERVPYYVNAALRELTIINFPRLRMAKTRNMPLLEVANFSHNLLSDPGEIRVFSDSLRVVDLSHNHLTTFSAHSLPPSGELQELYLQGNAIRHYEPLALYPSLGKCISVPASELGSAWAQLQGRLLVAPLCSLINETRLSGLDLYSICVLPECNGADPQYAVSVPCASKKGQLDLLKIRPWKVCDGATDCLDVSDEMMCQGSLELIASSGQEQVGGVICSQLPGAFGSTFTVRNGLLRIDTSPVGQKAYAVPFVTVSVQPTWDMFSHTATSVSNFIDEVTISGRILGLPTPDGNATLEILGLTQFQEIAVSCTYTYRLSAASAPAETTTAATSASEEPLPPEEPGSAAGAGGAGVAPSLAIGVSLGGICVVVAVVIVVLLRRQRRAHLSAFKMLDDAAIDAGVLLRVCWDQ
jgi:hypothetical protein